MASSSTSMQLRSSDNVIYLVGDIIPEISGRKLPSKRQVLAFLFYNIREKKYTVKKSASIVVDEIFTFWAKARIPTNSKQKCVEKVQKLYDELRSLWKLKNRKDSDTNTCKQTTFRERLDDLFDISAVNAERLITIEEDRLFLEKQRRPGREGYMSGVDTKLAAKEERKRDRNEKLESRARKWRKECDDSSK
jgi:hypothetical protein